MLDLLRTHCGRKEARMTTGPTNDPGWRSLANRLTPEQIAWLNEFERDEEHHPDLPWMTVAIAQDYAKRNFHMRAAVDELIRRHGPQKASQEFNDILVSNGHCPLVADVDELRGIALLIDGLRA